MDKIQISKEIRSAIKSGNLEKVVELIDSNVEVLNMITPFGTWLHVAASRGELDIVKKLIELGVNINTLGGSYGGGALNVAASKGHINVVRYLLSCGADLDISDPIRNPLFGAISNGYPDIAKLLIESGIDVNVKYTGESMKAMDALAFAKEQGQGEIVKLLENQKGCSTTSTEINDNNQNHHHMILEYVTKHFGPIKNTISEIVPGSRVSVNIHIIPPSVNKDFVTLVTTGMSDEPMDYSNEEGVFKYAELLLKLPSSWIVEKDSMKDQDHYWPLGWLRKVARIPHIYDGLLEEGVILPNGEPPQPFASNTKLSCIMVCRPQEPGLDNVYTKQGNINIYTLVPIYEEERNFVLEKGHDYLLKRMSEKGISDVLDIDRVNVGL
ncbi:MULTISPECIES: suppressor of fused domain protein [unclassified Bacillus (in: firmicutes)]|uniref:suppressor of fused domain protein n=1 Tax=unclassified Bacillus (in: firmicutes) TaxID=185979 RepID=UPI0008EBE274|nr:MULTISPECIES: suppressor of fused domain protein [unclassified Bacillus (in: firmicutes)]SFK11722.1 Ankyrin repeat-containing protein [Bacillus sp. 71mf]SFS97666.1 Ankyrin repeat-containing protein [Bacillus sp. 103mf]